MSIGDSMTLVSCLVGLMLAFPGVMIFLHLMFNRTGERAVARLSRGTKTAFFAGLIPLVVLGWLSFMLLSVGSFFQLIGFIMLLLWLGWALTGMAITARLIGVKLNHMAKRGDNPFLETVSGAFVLTFAVAFPLVGWFLVLPLSWIIGCGGMVLVLIHRRTDFNLPQIAPTMPTYAAEQAAGD